MEAAAASDRLEGGSDLKLDFEAFNMEESLGEGSFGKVHRATIKETGQDVAIKVVSIDEEPELLEKEIAIMEETDFEYLVSFIGYFVRGREVAIVMEYCGAGAASEMMETLADDEDDRPLPEHIIAVICLHTLRGLQYLHKARKIHRDIKGCNILLTEDGVAKLADFGIASQITTMQTHRNTRIGTPFWMAPEVISCSEYDDKADIWSLGITAIEFAETRPPHTELGHPLRALMKIPLAPSPTLQQPEKWSPAFNSFLARSLRKDPKQRASAEELLEDPFVKGCDENDLREYIAAQMPTILERRAVYNETITEKEKIKPAPNKSTKSKKKSPKQSPPVDSGTAVDMGTVVNYDTVVDSGTSVDMGTVLDSGSSMSTVVESGTCIDMGSVADDIPVDLAHDTGTFMLGHDTGALMSAHDTDIAHTRLFKHSHFE